MTTITTSKNLARIKRGTSYHTGQAKIKRIAKKRNNIRKMKRRWNI
jgi:hypothetical protein